MPIKRTAYSCGFKCGKKVVLSQKSMREHEDRCFSNPDTKSCRTCNSRIEEYGDEVYIGHQFGEPAYDSGGMINYCEKEIDIEKKWKTQCPEYSKLIKSKSTVETF